MKILNLIICCSIFFFSCTSTNDVLNRVSGSWTLSHTEGLLGDVSAALEWSILKIEDDQFQLISLTESGDQEEVARGFIEECESSIFQNCFSFSITFKKIGSSFFMENEGSKIIRIQDGAFSLESINGQELSYFF